jgi:hypothetical protein
MKIAKRTLTAFGALTLAAVLLSLIVPHAAQAVVATLVQVVNTAAAPAVTQDVSKLASQNMSFTSSLGLGFLTENLHVRGKDGVFGPAYTVPPGQTLMITSVDFFANSAFNFTPAVTLNDSANISNSQYAVWGAPPSSGVSSQFTYPAGIAIQSGITPSLSIAQPGFSGSLIVNLHGYLTSN